MTKTSSGTGVVLPLETLAMLGAGAQGAAAIRNYGFSTAPDFWAELVLLEERLEASDEDAAAAQLGLSRALVAAAIDAHSWLSIRSEAPEVPPAIVLVGEFATIAAVLHGPVVEYSIGASDATAEIVGAAVEAAGDSLVSVTGFDEDICTAALRFESGAADIAATDPGKLERLTIAAGGGLTGLLAVLPSELAQAPMAG